MKDDPEIFKRTRDSDNAATEPRLSTAGLASPRRSAGKSVADALRGGAVSPRDARNLRQAHAEERMADDAEQRSVEQILALEEELERSRTASASKIQELGKRLSEAEARAIAAEGEIEESRAQVAKLEKALREAEERAGTQVERGEPLATAAKRPHGDQRAAANVVEPTLQKPTSAAAVSLSSATFEDLRGLGLSVTQAKRVLDFRKRLHGFDSVDDLDYVPGFPSSFLAELKRQITV